VGVAAEGAAALDGTARVGDARDQAHVGEHRPRGHVAVLDDGLVAAEDSLKMGATTRAARVSPLRPAQRDVAADTTRMVFHGCSPK
jgi:hypothetical protein